MPLGEDLQVTPVEEWDDEPEGFIVTLPESRKNVRVKRTLDMMTQLKAGMIPNPLARIVREMMLMGAGKPEELETTFDKFDDVALQQMLELQDDIVVSAVTEPKVSRPDPKGKDEENEAYIKRLKTWTPPKGTLSLLRIPTADRQYISAVAQGAAVDVEPFRAQQAAHVADLETVEAVQGATQQPPRAARRSTAKSAKKRAPANNGGTQ